MEFFDKLKQKFEHYGPVPFIETKDQSIEVPSTGDDGFSVSASVGDHGIAVGYERGHWHEDFESDDEAINCFMSGVFGEARLAVTKRGNFAHSWTVEVLNDGRWVPFSTTGYFFFPFWRRATVHYLRNDRKPSHTSE